MIDSSRKLKAKVKNMLTSETGIRRSEKSRMLIGNFLMERFLERISMSQYQQKFILKGGMLVSAYTGLEMRTTKDIDITVRSASVKTENAVNMIEEISKIDAGDNVTFEVQGYSAIMEEHDYPGLRFTLVSRLDDLRQHIKIDISTDDVITPDAVQHEYRLMFEDRTISLSTYNLETLLAEKIQTIIVRGGSNTRTRDYYDIYMLTRLKSAEISLENLKAAFEATSRKRGTFEMSGEIYDVLNFMLNTKAIQEAWENFKNANDYVGEASWKEVIDSIHDLAVKIIPLSEEPTETEEEHPRLTTV